MGVSCAGWDSVVKAAQTKLWSSARRDAARELGPPVNTVHYSRLQGWLHHKSKSTNQ
jgi:hypothetical protein